MREKHVVLDEHSMHTKEGEDDEVNWRRRGQGLTSPKDIHVSQSFGGRVGEAEYLPNQSNSPAERLFDTDLEQCEKSLIIHRNC